MIKKIIGLILIGVIFFFAIKTLTLLPAVNNFAIGKNKSPFQVGTEYVNQMNNIYPYTSQGATYDKNIRYGDGVNYNNPGLGSISNSKILSKITLEKSFGKLILTIENGNPTTNLNIWLTNTSDITNQTQYIDFGPLNKSLGTKSYVVDMKNGDISLSEYKNILIVDRNFNIYGRVILN